MRKSFYHNKHNGSVSNLVMSSVEVLPGDTASVAFTVDSGKVFRDRFFRYMSHYSLGWCRCVGKS